MLIETVAKGILVLGAKPKHIVASVALVQVFHRLWSHCPFKIHVAVNLVTCLLILTAMRRNLCDCSTAGEWDGMYIRIAGILDFICELMSPGRGRAVQWTSVKSCKQLFTFGPLSIGVILLSRWAWIAEKESRRHFVQQSRNSFEVSDRSSGAVENPCHRSDFVFTIALVLSAIWNVGAVLVSD